MLAQNICIVIERHMPTLKNNRHEQFARNLVEITKSGGTHGRAYHEAGFKSEGAAADVCASKLLSDTKNGIAERVRELMANGAKRVEVSVASLLRELELARSAAQTDGQFSSAVAAISGKFRVAGLDREDGIGGSEFAKCETADEVMRVLMANETPTEVLEQLTDLQAEVERYAANLATLVPGSEPARPRPNEIALSLARSLPRRRRR
jgi:hypothetical protein